EARPAQFVNGPMGNCLGCHVGVSPDGLRIAAGSAVSVGPGPLRGIGLIIDAQSGNLISTGTTSDSWGGGTFDPSGALVPPLPGVLQLRNGPSGALIARIDSLPAVSPEIAPDGGRLAFIETDVGTTNGGIGTALRVAPWSARDARLGEAQILVAATNGRGIEDP